MKQRPGFEHAERIAFATSEPLPDIPDTIHVQAPPPARWTELAVFFDHQPAEKGRPWIAMASGMSTYAGEKTREEVIRVGSLERALKLFDEGTQLGRSVCLQARDWVESLRGPPPSGGSGESEPSYIDRFLSVFNAGGTYAEAVAQFDDVERSRLWDALRDFCLADDGFEGTDQKEALRWLYGDELDKAKPASLLARDFGVGESTARMQLKAGRPIMIPFAAAMRFFNRRLFQKEMRRG